MAPILVSNTSSGPVTVNRAGATLEPGGWAVVAESDPVAKHLLGAGLIVRPEDIDLGADDVDPRVAALADQLVGQGGAGEDDDGAGDGGSAAPPAPRPHKRGGS